MHRQRDTQTHHTTLPACRRLCWLRHQSMSGIQAVREAEAIMTAPASGGRSCCPASSTRYLHTVTQCNAGSRHTCMHPPTLPAHSVDLFHKTKHCQQQVSVINQPLTQLFMFESHYYVQYMTVCDQRWRAALSHEGDGHRLLKARQQWSIQEQPDKCRL